MAARRTVGDTGTMRLPIPSIAASCTMTTTKDDAADDLSKEELAASRFAEVRDCYRKTNEMRQEFFAYPC